MSAPHTSNRLTRSQGEARPRGSRGRPQNKKRATRLAPSASTRRPSLVARGGVEPPTYRFSGGRSYQLSYLAREDRKPDRTPATQTGLEPATFAVTGRRANQLRHWALLLTLYYLYCRAPNGIRTRATALKGRGPRPLDDEDSVFRGPRYEGPWHPGPPTAVRWKHE